MSGAVAEKKKIVDLDRRFYDVSQTSDTEQTYRANFRGFGSEKSGMPWLALLEQKLVVILGAAGSGKSTEIKAQAARLRLEGSLAVIFRLEALCRSSADHSIDPRRLQRCLKAGRLRGLQGGFF